MITSSFYTEDHLGNTRVTYTVNMLQEDDPCPVDPNQQYAVLNTMMDYYPYGKVLRSYVEGDEERYLTTQHERDQETGLDYRGARFYDSDIARFNSLDPLASDFVSWSAFNYVMGNPISLIDPDGRSAFNPWKDKDGNLLDENQRKDVKVYIFYDSTKNGEDGGFPDQTMAQYDAYEAEYGKGSVALSDAKTADDFSNDWSNMDGSPELIVMNLHGSDQAIHLDTDPDGNPDTKDGEYIVSTENGLTNRSETPGVQVRNLPKPAGNISGAGLLLNTCNSCVKSGSFTSGKLISDAFKDAGVGFVRASSTKINFETSGSRFAYPADGDWNPFNNSDSKWIYK